MPTAIADLDLDRPPVPMRFGPRYEECLLVLRVGSRPVGRLRLPLAAGELAETTLARALDGAGSLALGQAWIDRQTGALAPPSVRGSVTVAVCSRDRPELLARCLESLAALPDDGQEILVVDSASRGDATVRTAAGFAGVRTLREERPGLDRARNRALEAARGELVAFVDDDATVEPDWLRALTAPFGEDPSCLVATGLVLPAALETPAQELFESYFGFGRGYEARILDRSNVPVEQAWRCGVGASMAMRREVVLEELGGFDEALDAGTPNRAGGDNDLFARAIAHGGRVHYRPGAVARHRHGEELRALRGKFFGYGISWYAFLRRCATRHGSPGAWRELRAGLGRQSRRIGRAIAGRPGAMPAGLLIAELGGWLAGPFADLRSRGGLARRPARARRPGSAPAAATRSGVLRLVELDLAGGLETARAALEAAPATVALLRHRERLVGALEAEGDRIDPAALDRALRGSLRFELLDAWSRAGEPVPAGVPAWGPAALRGWIDRLVGADPESAAEPSIERFLAGEDRHRELQEWIRARAEDDARLARLEAAMAAEAERRKDEFAALQRELETLGERHDALARERETLLERVRAAGGEALTR